MPDQHERPKSAWNVVKEHAKDVGGKAFWVAVAVTFLLEPSPAVILKVLTALFGAPSAGSQEAITIWNVVLHTFPLTNAIAIDAGILFWFAKHPERYPSHPKAIVTLWSVLGGIIIVSMLIGSWLGAVEMSAWTKRALEKAEELQQSVDPKGTLPRGILYGLVRTLGPIAAVIPIAAVAIGGVVNYFTLYGMQMFFASLIVGALLGWI